jgi:hypothetical protein
MKRKKVWIMSLIMLSLVVGCSKSKNVETETQEQEEQIEEKKVTIVDETSNSRPYAVVINNYPAAIKVESGLDKAYLVYEFPIEGGISRSLALYKDIEDVKIGTIRSARQYYIDYVLENDAIFVHYGWNHPAEEKEKTLNIDYIDGNSRDHSPFYREKHENLATEHTVYTNLKDIIAYATNKRKYRTTTDTKQPFNYSSEEINLNNESDALKANSIRVTYSSSYYVDFTYNEESKKYLRSYNGKEHTDYFTKEQYSTKNIIVMLMETGSLSEYKDAAGTNYLDLKNITSGTGYYITNGYAKKINWSKASTQEQTKYTYLDGTELTVNDGNTWIMIQDVKKTTIIK